MLYSLLILDEPLLRPVVAAAECLVVRLVLVEVCVGETTLEDLTGDVDDVVAEEILNGCEEVDRV